MPNTPRIVLADVPMHITQRGNDRMTTFRCRADFARFRALLADASTRSGCSVHAYAFMSNHVHLLVTPAIDEAAARMMQLIGARYARYFNRRYHRTGTLWEGRFRSAVVDCDTYFFSCSRYIEMNPVDARMVRQPADYEWSSFRCNALGFADALVTPHPLFTSLGASDQERRDAYQALFATPLPQSTIDAIRRATWRGEALGDQAFCASLEAVLGRPVTHLPHGGDRRGASFQAGRIASSGQYASQSD